MDTTIKGVLTQINQIYGDQDDRLYELEDIIYYHQKFLLRYFENKNNKDHKGMAEALTVATAWFTALLNRFHVDLEHNLAKRYSYKCPFCLEIPCVCETKSVAQKTGRPVSQIPKDLIEWQDLVAKIYPDIDKNTDFDLLFKQDQLHQLFRKFRKTMGKTLIKDIEAQCADYFILILRVFNQLDLKAAQTFVKFYKNGCYVCKSTPCKCFYSE